MGLTPRSVVRIALVVIAVAAAFLLASLLPTDVIGGAT